MRAGLTYLVPGLLSGGVNGGHRVWGVRMPGWGGLRQRPGSGQESLGSGSGWGHPCLGVPERRPLEAGGGGCCGRGVRWPRGCPWSP